MQKYKNEENEKMKILLQQIITGISIGSIYALIASGYALVYSLLDFSNWAHGEVCMLGAYVCFMATTIPNMPYWLSCLLGIGGAAVISFLNEKIAYRKIRNNGSPNMFLMIAAMGLSTTYQNLANVIWGSKFKQLPKIFSVGTINLNGIFIGTTIMLIEQNAHKALKLCDRAYLMNVGNIVASGTGKELLADNQLMEAYLG